MSDKIGWSTSVPCEICGDHVQNGLANMLDHYREKHGLKNLKEEIINKRLDKGSALSLNDYTQLIIG